MSYRPDICTEPVSSTAEPVLAVQRVKVTEHVLPKTARINNAAADGGGIQDLEQLERRMLLQEVQDIRQRSRRSLMEPIKEEVELAFRSVQFI